MGVVVASRAGWNTMLVRAPKVELLLVRHFYCTRWSYFPLLLHWLILFYVAINLRPRLSQLQKPCTTGRRISSKDVRQARQRADSTFIALILAPIKREKALLLHNIPSLLRRLPYYFRMCTWNLQWHRIFCRPAAAIVQTAPLWHEIECDDIWYYRCSGRRSWSSAPWSGNSVFERIPISASILGPKWMRHVSLPTEYSFLLI